MVVRADVIDWVGVPCTGAPRSPVAVTVTVVSSASKPIVDDGSPVVVILVGLGSIVKTILLSTQEGRISLGSLLRVVPNEDLL